MPAINYKSLYVAFSLLMTLLIATIVVSFFQLGTANIWVALTIAVTKTLLIVYMFMGLARSRGTVQLVAGTSVLWLTIAILLVMSDYLSRGWDETQARDLPNGAHARAVDTFKNSATK